MDLIKLKESIVKHEGKRLKPYKDTVGKLTIGVGRNLDDVGITYDECDYMLNNDIQRVFREARGQDWWDAVSDNDARSRAMVELLFNVGGATLAKFKHALAALRNRDYGRAADEFLDSLWAKQVGARAITITKMIRNGTD